MTEFKSSNFDFAKRATAFALEVRSFTRRLPRTVENLQDIKQVTRSSGSIGANYIEANEALGSKDFVHRLKIARKEAKETGFWLTLVFAKNDEKLDKDRQILIQEAKELLLILSAMIRNASVK